MNRQTYTATLAYAKDVAPGVRHFALTTPEGFEYTPGQFITIHFEHGGETFKRSYSIASIPGETETLDLAASYFPDGPGSEFLFALKPDDAVTLTGPFGRLVLRDETPKRYVFIATGTGVTPYRCMLPELKQRLQNTNLIVELFLGVQSRAHALYAEDFLAMQAAFPNFHFHACYSRAFPEDAQPHEHQGYVQKHAQHIALNPEQDIVYLCGNPAMIDEMFEFLKAQDFGPRDVRREKYIS